MSDNTISKIAQQIEVLRQDPGIIQAKILDLVESVSNGQMVVMDPNNPFALGLEMASALAVNNLTQDEMLSRRAYPSLTNRIDDLYRHMSDYDFKDVFATPSSGTFTFLLDKDEVISKTVNDPNLPGTKRLTIPRYTKIVIQDIPFTLLYPIDIKLVRSGGLLISYNTENTTPLQTLKTNMLVWDIVYIDNKEYLRIKAELKQLAINRYIPQLNASSGFSKTYPIEDNFHYARAFIKKGNYWIEIRTTHSDKVYDPKVPTIVLQVTDQGLRATVPQVYTNNGSITDAVRLDIYTTKAKLDLSLGMVEHNAYKVFWDSIPTERLDEFSAPILTISRFAVFSDDTITGGTNGLSFEELRDRVISRSISSEGVPITRAQLNNKLSDLGYQLVTNIDDITDRQFLATRKTIAPPDDRTITSISAMVGTIQKTMTELEIYDTVSKNSRRDTIKPGTLYEVTNGVVDIVSNTQRSALWNMKFSNPEYLVNVLNDKQYMYSPFYYVIDSNINEINCRVYHLDDPVVVSRFYQDSNDALGVNISVQDYWFYNSPNKDGYIFEVLLNVGQTALKLGPEFISVQLSYIGKDRIQNRYWLEGELVSVIDPATGFPVDNIYQYRFHIETRYDVDPNDGLIPTPFKSPVDLEHDFDLVTIIRDFLPPDVSPTKIDKIVSKESIPGYNSASIYTAVNHERYRLKFGDRLNHIWHKTRTIYEYDMYARYPEDVIDYYEEDVYVTDSTGSVKVTYNPESNKITTTKLFSAGERKVNQYGETIYKHRKDDIVLDDYGDPVIREGGRGLQRHIDILLLDARYLFVDQVQDITYRNNVRDSIADWCVNDMVRINSQLLERSEIFYYPIRTTGVVEVLADNNLDASINAEQQFNITFWLTKEKYANTSLREMIEAQAVKSIQSSLDRSTVSLDQIIDNLRFVLGNNIVSVHVQGFTDDQYSAVSIKDSSMGLNIAKRARLLSNNQIEMVNDVKIEFLTHGE